MCPVLLQAQAFRPMTWHCEKKKHRQQGARQSIAGRVLQACLTQALDSLTFPLDFLIAATGVCIDVTEITRGLCSSAVDGVGIHVGCTGRHTTDNYLYHAVSDL